MENQDGQINGLNLHLDLKDVGGVWANFAAIKHSDYESVSYTHLTLPTNREV